MSRIASASLGPVTACNLTRNPIVSLSMDPASLAVASLVWLGSTEIAAGRGERGPWQMNESRYDYVDDPTVAIDERGGVVVAWVDQARKDVYFWRDGKSVNVSRSPETFS